jgi:nicotinate dehydrogenase subunit B
VVYETIKAYCAVAVEIAVNSDTGQVRVVRAIAAIDCGNAVSPNGIENQIQGCIMQATSWTFSFMSLTRSRGIWFRMMEG